LFLWLHVVLGAMIFIGNRYEARRSSPMYDPSITSTVGLLSTLIR
jgi:hypothetical protein